MAFCDNAFSHAREKSYTKENIYTRLDDINFIPIEKGRISVELKKHNVSFKDENTFNQLSEENLNSILAAIRLLPREFQFFFPGIIINRNEISGQLGEYKHVYFGEYKHHFIFLTDSWSQAKKYVQIGTVIHEIGHLFGTLLGDVQNSVFWQNIQCQWDNEWGISWNSRCPDSHISRYSTTNPREDWAESFTTYILDPAELEEVTPEKHKYIKSILSVDASSANDSILKKSIPLKERRWIKKESILYKTCLKNFGKKLMRDCLILATFEQSKLLTLFSDDLGDQLPHLFSATIKKMKQKEE